MTASPDSTIRVWNVDSAACSQVIKVGINILLCIVCFDTNGPPFRLTMVQ